MARTGLTFALVLLALPLAACVSNEEAAQKRCVQGGAQPGTPTFEQCMRDELAWRQQNRALQNRIYTQ